LGWQGSGHQMKGRCVMARGVLTFKKFDGTRITKYLKLLEEGKTRKAAAVGVGCSALLIREYRKRDPEFARQEEAAIEKGCDAKTDEVEDALHAAALKGNVTAIQVWLYNRRPSMWKDMRSFRLYGLDDVLKLLPPELVHQLKPFLNNMKDE
jgi:hypothetical protein